MLYIKKIDGVWQTDEYYKRYLPTVWGQCSEGVKNLIHEGRNGIGVPEETFYDAIVTSVNVTARFEPEPRTDILLDLVLGSQHDQVISVHYRDVVKFSLRQDTHISPIPPIMIHEIVVHDTGDYIHEIEFVTSDTWMFTFREVYVRNLSMGSD